MSEKQTTADNRARNNTAEFREFIGQGWASTEASKLSPADVAAYTPRRRDELSAAFPGERLVIPAGGLKVRSNDCDYMFRAHTAFAYLTGIGAEGEPDSVLVLEPREQGGHDAVLFIRPLAPRDSEEFFHDARYGEYWVGARPTLEEAETTYGIAARHLDELPTAIGKDAGHVSIRVVRDADAEVTASVDQARQTAGEQHATDEAKSAATEQDSALAAAISSARMTKDDYEIAEMQKAVDATLVGFEAVIKDLPRAVGDDKGERWVEGVFGLHARHGGNGVGYDSICASGDHANTLHWIKNTGPIREGDLLLLDAGVEVDSLFTADITRTLPVSGTFTDAQRKIYDAVYAAQQAGFAAAKPGNKFSDIHEAAIRVIAEHLYEWGLLPDGIDVEATLDKEHGMYHRRWMVHGTSHHLGLDVHDCGLATREQYMDAELKPGMVLTVEPGLYFKADDLLAPEEFRGNGVRIEDDLVITEDGCDVLSKHFPSTSADVEDWIKRLQSS